MPLINALISQLWTYSIAWWALFIGITFVCAWIGRVPGIISGELTIAVIIAVLDVRWVRAEMHMPGWNGQPDQDTVFMIGRTAKDSTH